jgi:hypothetical protein
MPSSESPNGPVMWLHEATTNTMPVIASNTAAARDSGRRGAARVAMRGMMIRLVLVALALWCSVPSLVLFPTRPARISSRIATAG